MMTICIRCGNEINSKRSSKKYCSVTCRQYAYLERNGMQPAAVTKQASVNGILPATIDDKNTNQVSINDDKVTVNDTKPIIISDANKTFNDGKTRFEEEPDPDGAVYDFITPAFFTLVEGHLEKTNLRDKFQRPSRYWNAGQQYYIISINTQLRCLLDNLIRIGYKREIPSSALIQLSMAFEQLCNSLEYKCLPDNYPCRTMIEKLDEDLYDLSVELDGAETTRFMLGKKRNAQLLATLNGIGNTVERKPFAVLFPNIAEPQESPKRTYA